MTDKVKKLQATIDRLEEDKAVLKFADGQTLTVALEFLPDEAGEGDVLSLSWGSDNVATENKEAMAKAMLNELLKKKE